MLYSVPVLEAENAKMNVLVDEPACNDPLMRSIAASRGTVSRSGRIVPASVNGILESSGEAVRGEFTRDSISVAFRTPVQVSEQHEQRRSLMIRGFGDDARRLVEQIADGHRKKGGTVEIVPVLSIENPEVKFSISGNLFAIRRELFKIAYLATVRLFGDAAIEGPSGQQFRAAIMASTDAELTNAGIVGGECPIPPPGFGRALRHEHAVTCVVLPGIGVVTCVHLFGLFGLLAVTPPEGISAPELTGELTMIDASSKSARSRPYIEVMPALVSAALNTPSDPERAG